MSKRILAPGSTMTASVTTDVLREAAQAYGAADYGSVSGNTQMATGVASTAIFRPQAKVNPETDRFQMAKPWQVEAYRQVNLCGEARYAVTLFAAIAGRAELGISEPQTLRNKATWINNGPEVEALAELAPTVRERTKLLRDYMLHRNIAGECYLIARERVPTDPGYVMPPIDPGTNEPYDKWDDYLRVALDDYDPLDYDDEDESSEPPSNPNVGNPIWEIVGVTEIRRTGKVWSIRHDNDNWLDLRTGDPVIRLWNPDPERRREAWSPLRSLIPTLREIEWLTAHIFTQVKSRLVSAGVWFMPRNLTFPPPPVDAIKGGAAAMATMNEAQLFAASLAASAMQMLDPDEVAFPTIVMTDENALANIDQNKLIKFWSEIDDKAMLLRSDAIRRFALGMDMPPEQTLGSSGLAVSNSGGSAGSVNHWGEWAKQEQTISDHIEPALDDFVGVLTTSFLRTAVEGTKQVVAYDTASLRLRQDLSEAAIAWYDRGILKATVALKETGFDPENDMMDAEEHKFWLLNKIVGGTLQPEQIQAALLLLGLDLPVDWSASSGGEEGVKGLPGRNEPRNTDSLPHQGPPRGDHEHNKAPYSALHASCEVLVLRALEKAGNKVLNDGKRGKDRDRTTLPHLAHLTASLNRTISSTEFDFSLANQVLDGLDAPRMTEVVARMGRYCADLYNTQSEYSREGLMAALAVS